MGTDALETATEIRDRLDEARRDAWRAMRTSTLTTSSGVLVLSFLLLGIKDFHYTWLLAAAWLALTAALVADVASLMLDYRHSMYQLLKSQRLLEVIQSQIIEQQGPIQTASQRDALKTKLDSWKQRTQPSDRRAATLERFVDWLAYAAVAALVSGVSFLIALGMINLWR